MFGAIKDSLSRVWVWLVAGLAGALALASFLFLNERKARKSAEATGKADNAGAKAEVYEQQAAARTDGTLPVLEAADKSVEAQVEQVRKETIARVEAGKDDDAKKLVEEFRRAGY